MIALEVEHILKVVSIQKILWVVLYSFENFLSVDYDDFEWQASLRSLDKSRQCNQKTDVNTFFYNLLEIKTSP